MALTRQQKMPSDSSDVWDESLFGQAVNKARLKTDALQQAAGEALTHSQSSKLLPLVVSSKLLLPLTGVFAALLITAAWQSDLTSKVALKFQSSTSYEQLVPGYEYLGAVGVVTEGAVLNQVSLISQKANQLLASTIGEALAWPTRAQNLTAAIAATGGNVVATFGQSVKSFQQGVGEIYSQLKTSIINIFNSFNQSFFDLYDNLLSGIGFLSDRIELALDNFFRPVKTSTTQGWQETVATAGQVSSGLNKLTTDLTSTLSNLKAKVINWWQMIVKSWQDFISGLSSAPAAGTQVDQEVKSDIKEIKQDVKSLIKAFNNQGVPAKVNQQGMVVVPSTGAAETDAQMKARIASMFSDPVQVKLDGSGQSGIITPTFTEGDNGDYLFLLAPINQ